jgi:hypothetical protein
VEALRLMDLEALIGIGCRDLVLVIAALLGVYLVLSVMRLFQIDGRRRRSVSMERETPAMPDMQETQGAYETFNYAHGDDEPHVGEAQPPVFASELARSNVEAEVMRLHREAAQLRNELARVSEEVSHLKAQRNVSPLYDEAMSLAQQGMPAAGIAGHCGISVGEAELVAALARNESEFKPQEDEEDGNERYTGTGRS